MVFVLSSSGMFGLFSPPRGHLIAELLHEQRNTATDMNTETYCILYDMKNAIYNSCYTKWVKLCESVNTANVTTS